MPGTVMSTTGILFIKTVQFLYFSDLTQRFNNVYFLVWGGYFRVKDSVFTLEDRWRDLRGVVMRRKGAIRV